MTERLPQKACFSTQLSSPYCTDGGFIFPLTSRPFLPHTGLGSFVIVYDSVQLQHSETWEFSDVPKERGRGRAELAGCLEDCLHAKKGYDLM